MDRSNHYEAAVEAYLRWHGLCYIAVDETRRAELAGVRVKSVDFLVYSENGARLVVDVKGRRFPGGPPHRPRRVWECWSTQEDIDGLTRWTELSGPGYQGVLLFCYFLQPGVEIPADTVDLWTWKGRRYLLRAVAVDDYRQHLRVRSPRWGTVDLPRAIFQDLVRPVEFFTGTSALAEEVPFDP